MDPRLSLLWHRRTSNPTPWFVRCYCCSCTPSDSSEFYVAFSLFGMAKVFPSRMFYPTLCANFVAVVGCFLKTPRLLTTSPWIVFIGSLRWLLFSHSVYVPAYHFVAFRLLCPLIIQQVKHRLCYAEYFCTKNKNLGKATMNISIWTARSAKPEMAVVTW